MVDQRRYRFDIIAIVAKHVGNIAPFDITEVAHPAHEFLANLIVVRGSRSDVSDARGLGRLLRARRERPRRRRAAEQRDERAPLHHSITSSARASSLLSSIVTPRALTVVRLTTRSNFIDCSTGMSAGFVSRPARLACSHRANRVNGSRP